MKRGELPKAPSLAAVTLDCWQTLLVDTDNSRAIGLRTEALKEAASRTGRVISTVGATEILDAAWRRHTHDWQDHKAVGSGHMARWCLESLGLGHEDVSREAPELERIFAHAGLQSEIQPLDGARETLEFLIAAGVRCALVCDTGYSPGPVVRQFLARAGLLENLEAQIFSDEVGVPKPEPAIFHAALRALGAGTTESVHVGDLKRTDVAGARSLGMRTVRIRQTHDDASPLSEADCVVDSHADLRAALAPLIPV